MMSGKLHIFEDAPKLIQAFSAYFKSLVMLQDRPFNVALSGGSTPIQWFDYMVVNNQRDIIFATIPQIYWDIGVIGFLIGFLLVVINTIFHIRTNIKYLEKFLLAAYTTKTLP